MHLSKQKPGSTNLFCFSPPVMAATFAIELILMIYVFMRDRTSTVARLIGAILFFLAMFQLSEYGVCEQLGLGTGAWSRIGFISITALPVLGIHLIHAIAGIRKALMIWVAYLSAAIWFALFTFYDIFEGFGCQGNYVIFDLKSGFGGAYFTYYYVWLFVGIGLAIYFAKKANKANIKKALQALAFGYLLFIVPTTAINLINSETSEAIPSIMCGFAVLHALILSFVVLPNAIKSK